MKSDLHLQINGAERVFAALGDETSLELLILALELKADRVAVELNGTIVARSRWQSEAVRQGDKLELVHFVGGGC